MPKIHREEKEVAADSPKPVADKISQPKTLAGQTLDEALQHRASIGKLVDQMDFKAGWCAAQAATREREQAIHAAALRRAAEICKAKAVYANRSAHGKDEYAKGLLQELENIMNDTAKNILALDQPGQILLDEMLAKCPLCEHEWTRHDPEDGKCDAGPPCECGRSMAWMHKRIAELSRDHFNANRAAIAKLDAKDSI